MSDFGLTIIGERINPGFRSSAALLSAKDLPGLQALARKQVDAGARLLNINVGRECERDAGFMCDVIRAVQEAVAVPLSFDSPDPAVQRSCLAIYDAERAGGRPVVNSLTEHRIDMLDCAEVAPLRMLIMASERVENGRVVQNTSPEQVHATAARLVDSARSRGWTADDCIIDVSIGPMASDMEGITRRALQSIERIGADPDLQGVHMSVGLSNLSIMLPKQAGDGGPLGLRLENAFLTRAVPAGLDMVLGTPWRAYAPLPAGDFVLQGFDRVVATEDGYDAIEELQELYCETV